MSALVTIKTLLWNQKAKIRFHSGEMQENIVFPRRIFLELTNDCQLRCTVCPRSRMTRPVGYMDPALAEKVIAEGARYGPVKYHFYKDGEPFLHPALFRIVGAARRARRDNILYISTNGLLLDDARIDSLFEHDVDIVRFMRHANTKSTYDLITRQQGNFDLVGRNIHRLIQRKAQARRRLPEIRLQIQESPEAIGEVDAFLQHWQKLEVKPRSKRYITWNLEKAPSADRYPCKDLIDKAPITWDGRVVVSSLDVNAEVVFGDVNRHTLAEIWSGENAARYRQAHLRNQYQNLKVCEMCNEWKLLPNLHWRNRVAPWRKEKWL